MSGRLSPLTRLFLVLGFVFLYAPIVSLVVYSFNESRLVTVWSGFSLKWYGELFADRQLMDAAWVSLQVAFHTAWAAVLLGTMAAMALTRLRRFRGRTLLAAMITAPLVMPEVITGLSLLLLFVAIDLGRGFWTIAIAHTTFAMCFVAVVVQSRLVSFDRSLEEAAQDLGARPWKVFLVITLPIIAPALVPNTMAGAPPTCWDSICRRTCWRGHAANLRARPSPTRSRTWRRYRCRKLASTSPIAPSPSTTSWTLAGS